MLTSVLTIRIESETWETGLSLSASLSILQSATFKRAFAKKNVDYLELKVRSIVDGALMPDVLQ